MKILQTFVSLASWVFIAFLAVMALYVLSSNVNLFGGYKSYLVQSGSMEPTIMTGDIIVIRPQPSYGKNDAVTFIDEGGRTVTHRILNVEQKNGKEAFTTRGDANRSDDEGTISAEQIVGKVSFVVPKLGYMVEFSKSLPGLIILILIPAGLFVADELLKNKHA